MKDKLCDDFEKRDLYVRHVNYIGSFHFTKICVTIATKIMCTYLLNNKTCTSTYLGSLKIYLILWKMINFLVPTSTSALNCVFCNKYLSTIMVLRYLLTWFSQKKPALVQAAKIKYD